MPKEIKVIEDFSKTVHRWNDLTMESDELTLVGLHSLGNHVRVSGNWELFIGDQLNNLPLVFDTDIIRGRGIYYWSASQSIVNGAVGTYEYIIFLDHSSGDLQIYEIRNNSLLAVAAPEIVANTFSSLPPTFTDNGDSLYWQFQDGTSGVSTYLNRTGSWFGSTAMTSHLGQYHGSNLVDLKLASGHTLALVPMPANLGILYAIDEHDEEFFRVAFEHLSPDTDHEGTYGLSQTFEGGEGPISWSTTTVNFYTEFENIYISPFNQGAQSDYVFSKLVKGLKLWFRDSLTGDVILMMDIDFKEGVTLGNSSTTYPFLIGDADNQYNMQVNWNPDDIDIAYEEFPRMYTDETGLANSNMTESDLVSYKESVIFGNRRYAIGIDNNIYISPINQQDVLTIDMVISNLAISGEPIYIEPMSSGLIVFTEESALVVEGEMDEEAGFFVIAKTSEMKGAGLSSKESLAKTDSGTVWGNENGIYIYKDDKAQILSDKLDAYWLQNEISAAPIIGYSSVFNQVVIWLGDNETYNFLVYDTTNDTFFVLDSNFNRYSSDLQIPAFFTKNDGHLYNLYKDPTETDWFIGKYNELTSAEIDGPYHKMILGNNDCGTPYENKKFYRIIVTIFGVIDAGSDINITAKIYDTRTNVLSTHTDSITSADEIILDCSGAIGKSIGITLEVDALGTSESSTFGIDDVSIEYRGIGG